MRSRPAILFSLSAVAITGLLGGCAPERDPTLANHAFGADDRGAVVVWSDAQRVEAVEAMRDAMATAPSERPTAAKSGVRWSDVPLALYWGAGAAEMAIVSSEETGNVIRFTLVSVRDEPATLVVERIEDDATAGVTIRATATVGSFGQRTDEAILLEQEFRKALEGLGRKPGFEDDPRAKR